MAESSAKAYFALCPMSPAAHSGRLTPASPLVSCDGRTCYVCCEERLGQRLGQRLGPLLGQYSAQRLAKRK